MNAYQLTAAAAAECNAIRTRNAASIAAMPLRVVAYFPSNAAASVIVDRAKRALGSEFSAAELLADENLDAILSDALNRACSELGITSSGMELVAQ